MLFAWAAAFGVLAWLYWSPSTAPPAGVGGVDLGFDKAIHAAVHAALVAVPWLAMRPGPWRGAALALAVAAAPLLEIGQLAAPGRTFGWDDLAANMAGVALGAWIGRRADAM